MVVDMLRGCLSLINDLTKIFVALVILSVFVIALIVTACLIYYMAYKVVTFTFSKTVRKLEDLD